MKAIAEKSFQGKGRKHWFWLFSFCGLSVWFPYSSSYPSNRSVNTIVKFVVRVSCFCILSSVPVVWELHSLMLKFTQAELKPIQISQVKQNALGEFNYIGLMFAKVDSMSEVSFYISSRGRNKYYSYLTLFQWIISSFFEENQWKWKRASRIPKTLDVNKRKCFSLTAEFSECLPRV